MPRCFRIAIVSIHFKKATTFSCATDYQCRTSVQKMSPIQAPLKQDLSPVLPSHFSLSLLLPCFSTLLNRIVCLSALFYTLSTGNMGDGDQAMSGVEVYLPDRYEPPQRALPANIRRPNILVPGAVPRPTPSAQLQHAADAMFLPNFQYDQIDAVHTRLIKLDCNEPGARITITLRTVPFKDLGTKHLFEAISYHWGDEIASNTILVRNFNADQVRPREIKVRHNFYQGLQHLRMPNMDVWLWVDALCINQQNLREKDIQVKRMAEVFVAAGKVIIWLGEGEDSSK